MNKFTFFVALFLSMGIWGCEDKEENNKTVVPIECDCNSEKIGEISGEGTITFFKPEKEEQKFFHYYGNQYWITIKEKKSTFHYIICNQKFLKGKFDTLEKTKKSIKIKFSGTERKLCKNSPRIVGSTDAVHVYYYAIIELTSIEEL